MNLSLRSPRVASVLTVASAAAFAVAAPASAASAPSSDAGSFLGTQLAAGKGTLSVAAGGTSYPDTGLSIDAVLALTSAKTAGTQAASSTSAITAQVPGYVGTGSEAYAGSTAKALLFSAVRGTGTVVGGVNLVTQLKGLESTSGRFTDKSAYGDYSNGIGQALAVIALKKAGSPADAKAVTFLLSQQCADGGFRVSFTGACASDPDATSFAVQALAADGGHGAAVAKAVSYLASKQGADGGVGGGTGAAGENANSTGLAAVAFTVGGRADLAAKATSFVNSLQYGCDFPAALRGGIAYDRSTFQAKRAAGAKGAVSDSDKRSTAQATLAFTKQPYLAMTKGGAAATPTVSCGATAPVSKPTSKPATAPTSKPATAKPTARPTGSTSAAPTTKPSTTVTPAGAPSKPAVKATAAGGSTGTSASAGPTSTKPAVGPIVNTDNTGTTPRDNGGLAAVGLTTLLAAGGAAVVARRR